MGCHSFTLGNEQPTTRTGLRSDGILLKYHFSPGKLLTQRKRVLLLLFSSISQEERLATSPSLVTRLHLPHAIVVRVHVHIPDVGILIPERADLIWCLSSRPALSV